MSGISSTSKLNLSWFREAAFGMFVHWGLYAGPAGRWKGMETPVEGEWLMNTFRIPANEYGRLAETFNPCDFDASKWVRVAKDAGMKYMVATAKHHDGFAMFHSKCDRYNIVDATPFKRDPLKELSDACAKEGLRLGFYYSQDQDWHEPGGSGNDWDFLREPSVASIEGDVEIPLLWRVFAPFSFHDGIPGPELLREIPQSLELGGKLVQGRDVRFENGRFDFFPLLSGMPCPADERRAAFAFTSLAVERETNLTMGAGSDWWMQLWIDGELVVDTIRSGGNGAKPIACDNHVFAVRLSPGTHVVAARAIAGLDGAVFAFGGPRELKAAGWKPVASLASGQAPFVDLNKEFPRYLEKKVKPQLEELLTNYGKVSIIWFDTPYFISAEQSEDLKDFVRSLQPECLVSGRVGNGFGDYSCLGDNELPDKILDGVWEGLGATNHSWGFKACDTEWKSPKSLLLNLIKLSAKNANYLLNVGPDALGNIPPVAVESLSAVGEWLALNGEAIYGATPLPLFPCRATWGYLTRKANSLFLIVCEPPKCGRLELFGLRNVVAGLRVLHKQNMKLHFSEERNPSFDYHKISIDLPQELLQLDLPFVIAIDCDKPLDLNPDAYSVRGPMGGLKRRKLS